MAEEKVQTLGQITGVHRCCSVQKEGPIFARVPALVQSAPTFCWRRQKGNTRGAWGPRKDSDSANLCVCVFLRQPSEACLSVTRPHPARRPGISQHPGWAVGLRAALRGRLKPRSALGATWPDPGLQHHGTCRAPSALCHPLTNSSFRSDLCPVSP